MNGKSLLLTTNRSRWLLNSAWSSLALFLVLCLGVAPQGFAQNAQDKILADQVTHISDPQPSIIGEGDPTVENPDNAIADNDNFATLLASPGTLTLGNYEGVIELKFPQTIPANTWSYVRIGMDAGFFDALLGGSLGDDLGAVLGSLLLGSQNIIIDARMGSSTSVLSDSSLQGFSTDRVKLLKDGNGSYLLAIRPSDDYDRLRITNNSTALLLGDEVELKVYYAFYYNQTTTVDCGYPFATSFDGSDGLNLQVLDYDNQNLGNAIDADANTFSSLKGGALVGVNVGSTLSQFFYFQNTAANTTTVNLKLSMGSTGILNADLLGGVEVVFYNGDTIVYKRSLQSGLLNDTGLLNLLNGQPVTFTFAPGREFDRIAVRLIASAGVSLDGSAVKIYDIQRYNSADGCVNPLVDPIPTETEDPFDQASCATALADFGNVDFPLLAADGNNESFATLYADTGSLLVNDPTASFVTFDMGTLAANQTTYVRINYEQEVLDRLLGGSLGKFVSDLAGGLLLGNQFIQVEALSGGNVILDQSSSDAFAGDTNGVVSVVQDKIGRYYLAVTPNAIYDQVRISNHVLAVLPTGKKSSLDVYSACFEMGDDPCFPANFTSYKGGSILGLSVGNLSNVGVTNANHAIDGNSSSYSEINLGAASLGAYVYQTIYFNKPSQANDKVAVRLQLEPSSALTLGVLEEYKVKFYNGAESAGTYDLGGGLINNLDLLSLFNTGGIVELNFTPTATFDRVDIGLESTVQLNVDAAPMRIYNVERYGTACPRQITPSPFEDPSCSTLLVDASNANDVQNLFDADFDSYATLQSGAGSLLGIDAHVGFVELGYPTPKTAGTTSYIRIDFDEGVLNALLSGTLGNIASDLLNGVLLGNHYFEVEVKNNGATFESATSKDAASGATNIRIVQDKLGRYYIAVTPTQAYDSVRITDHTDSLLGLLAPPNTMNVYGMCTELSDDACLDAFATSYEYSGISLGVDALGTAGVKNPAHAIDDNTTNYSEISNGTLAVGAATTQWIYFNSPSSVDDAVQIKFNTQSGAVDLALLGSIEVKAYLGDQLVSTLDWGNGIISGINVVDILSNGQTVEVPFKPGAEFDRISVGIKSLASASVFPPIRLYSVERCYTLNEPTYTAWKSFEIDGDPSLTEVEGGEEITYTIHVRNTGGLDITGLTISDPLPENTTYVSGVAGVKFENDIISFDNINITVGTTETVSFKVNVDENLTGVDFIKNLAIVKLNETDPGKETYPPMPGDPDNPDDTGDTGTDIPVNPISSVVLWKAYDVGGDNTVTTVSGGETVNYHIYARNTGNQDLTALQISDVLPDGLTYVSGGTFDAGTNTVSFTIASLTVGTTSAAQSFSATVNADLTGILEIKNIATAQPDPNEPVTESYPPIDNTTTPTEPDTTAVPGTVIDVTPVHEVVVSKNGVSSNATPGQAQINDVVTYTISIENKSNEALTNVLVEDVLSADYSNPTATVGGSNVGTFNVNAFSYTIPSIAAGTTVVITIIADVATLDAIDADGNIVNTVDVTYRNSDDTADVIASATDYMPTSCTPILATDITLPIDFDVCYNTEVTLDASTTLTGLNNPIYKWYKTADLSDVPFEGASLTETLTETTTYYVTLEADRRCVANPPAEITVTVGAPVETPTLSAEGDITTLCTGTSTTLTAAVNDATGLTYQWFKDGAKIAGETTETLTVSDAGVYTAVAVNTTGCVSDVSAGLHIVVKLVPTTPVIDQTSPLEICEGQTDTLTTQAIGDAYRWYYNGDPVIIDDTAGVITYYDNDTLVVSQAGNYTVQVIDDTFTCPSLPSNPVDVIVNPTPVINFLDGDMITVGINETIDWQTVVDSITVEPTGATIKWYDKNQNEVDPLNLPTSYDESQIGVHTFYLVAKTATCSTYRAFRVNVYDPAACPVPMKRVYATVDGGWGSIITGGVSNTGDAVDGNPKTYSTLTTGVGLLGIGTVWQNIKFDHTVPAGTPVTIKLGKDYSLLTVAGGLSVVGIGENGMDIGVLQSVQGGLLDLLSADHVQEFTFIPVDALGKPQPYTGVRISSGALLSVAQNSKVYGAYYETQGQPSCDPVAPDVKSYVQDVLYGVKDLGLGVASSLASVVDPWNAVDNDTATAATINRAVGVLNAGFITVKFKNQVMPTDKIRIVTQDPGDKVVTLNVLSGSIIQRYLGDTPVGEPIEDGDVLQLNLLDFTEGKTALSVASYPQPYDAISIAIGNLLSVNLSSQFKIYDVSVRPLIESTAGDTIFEVCQGEELIIKKQDPCTVYEVTDDAGNVLAIQDSFSFTIPEGTPAGTYTYYVQAVRQGCTIGPKQEIEVVVLPKPEFTGIKVNGADLTSPYAFTVSPNDVVEVLPEIDTNGGTLAGVTWEMLNPNYDATNPGTTPQWIALPAELSPTTDAATGQLTLDIPDFGIITLPDGTEIDIRNTAITLRVSASNDSGCTRVSEDILMTVDGSSKFFSNPNIINKL